MVSSLGVKLGGRTVAAEPFEMTRGTLKDEALAGSGQMAAYLNEKIQSGQPVASAVTAMAPTAKPGEKTGSGCPFSAMVAEMGLTRGQARKPARRLRIHLDAGCQGKARASAFIRQTDGPK